MKNKLKTHRGAKKRFKVTANGKVVRRNSMARHILTKKTSNRKRKLGKAVLVSDADTQTVKEMLPYA